MTISATNMISDSFHTDRDSEESHHGRKASLSDVERVVLSALFIDAPPPSSSLTTPEPPIRILNDDMLFSVPPGLSQVLDKNDSSDNHPSTKINTFPKRPTVTKNPKDYRLHVGLWQAHEDGVTPKTLSRMASIASSTKYDDEVSVTSTHNNNNNNKEALDDANDDNQGNDNDDDDSSSMKSLHGSQSNVSWDDDESTVEHFDAWQVLKDEYAQEYGFDYQPGSNYMDESEHSHNQFKIIGTSADDTSSHPHVVTPPLLDSIMTHLPWNLRNQNYWMKYSLIRDGASLDTFKAYVRGAKDIILAIETTRGDVFGVYTSSPWRTSSTLFGGAPSFVWKMKYNRNFPCHSLIEQATLENEIDAYHLLDQDIHVQMCTNDKIGVGVGNMNRYDSQGNIVESEQEEEIRNGKSFGYAICLEDDLLSGTTSRSACYKSPCFVDSESNGEPFDVLNLEAWTLTPAFSQEAAEKLEMTQYFMSESIRSTMRSLSSIDTFSSRDLDQHSFYRRIGQGDSHQEIRDQWQFRTMKGGDGAGETGMGGVSPRYMT